MILIISSIILISIFLSIDNIIPIIVIANNLSSKEQRNMALFLGLLGGGVLRIILLFFAKTLLQAGLIVYILAGIFLLYIGIRGLVIHANEKKSQKKEQGLFAVISSIMLVDISLSVDNIAALIAITQNLTLLITGTFIAVLLLFLLSFCINFLLQKLQGLSTAAYLAIIFLGIKFLLVIGNIQIGNTITSLIVILICIFSVGITSFRKNKTPRTEAS